MNNMYVNLLKVLNMMQRGHIKQKKIYIQL